MPPKFTHEMYVDKVKELHPHITVLSKFVSFREKVRCCCELDGEIWDAYPQNVFRKYGCPRCSSNASRVRLQKTHDQFVSELRSITTTIEPLDQYVDSQTKMRCKCTIDNYEWMIRPNDLLRGKGCPECKRIKLSKDRIKSLDDVIADIRAINPWIEVIGEYTGACRPLRCKCILDGKEWDAYPNNLMRGEGCPECAESKGERAVSVWLKNNGIEYVSQYKFEDCKNIKPLPFDFYIPPLRICIEYDGEQHYRPVEFGGCSNERAQQLHKRTMQNDAIKNAFCIENNITLVRIPYYDFNHIDDILSSTFLKDSKAAVNPA